MLEFFCHCVILGKYIPIWHRTTLTRHFRYRCRCCCYCLCCQRCLSCGYSCNYCCNRGQRDRTLSKREFLKKINKKDRINSLVVDCLNGFVLSFLRIFHSIAEVDIADEIIHTLYVRRSWP